jgi:hypothetical protein
MLGPDTDAMTKHSELFQSFNTEARSIVDSMNDGEDENGNKRKFSDNDNNSSNKRVKQEFSDADYTKFDWAKEIASGRIKKLTIPELKIYLKKHKLTVGGKKEDLVQRIIDHCPPT